MSRSRMFGDDEPGDGQNPSPRTTIVGGRPPDDKTDAPPVPTGIQSLLRLASVDPKFLQELMDHRGDVALAAGIALTRTEHQVLAAIPSAQLAAMAKALPAPAPARRDFLRQTAATAVVLLGGAVLSESLTGCNSQPAQPPPPPPPLPPNPDPTPQSTHGPFAEPPPEPTPDRPDYNNMQTEGGAAPDVPPPRPDRNNMAPGGVRPDMEPPPATPDTTRPTRGIRPDLPPKPDSTGGQGSP